jgi:hypothetical protein
MKPTLLRFAIVPLLLVACDPAPDPSSPDTEDVQAALTSSRDGRGQLVSAIHLRTLSTIDVAAELAGAEFDATAVKFDVDMYQLVYRTPDASGRPTTASGLIALPRNGKRSLKTVSFAHGTEAFKPDAPSTAGPGWGIAPALTYASAGFAAVSLDYLGLGVGPGFHPWMDVPSEVSASVDMLRAARCFAVHAGRTLERDLFITGFSQGALAAMGLARALQEHADVWFRPAALAPISGPYDWSGWVRGAASGAVSPLQATFYLTYLTVAWNRIHHLYDDPSEVFLPPNDATMEGLFDNNHSGMEIVVQLPASPDQQFTTSWIDTLTNPTGRLGGAFQVADGVCQGWTPHMPTRLYMASGDHEVPYVSSFTCHAQLPAGSVDFPIDLGADFGHLDTNIVGTAAVLRWFTELR